MAKSRPTSKALRERITSSAAPGPLRLQPWFASPQKTKSRCEISARSMHCRQHRAQKDRSAAGRLLARRRRPDVSPRVDLLIGIGRALYPRLVGFVICLLVLLLAFLLSLLTRRLWELLRIRWERQKHKERNAEESNRSHPFLLRQGHPRRLVSHTRQLNRTDATDCSARLAPQRTHPDGIRWKIRADGRESSGLA
jgi:hypothetical protein